MRGPVSEKGRDSLIWLILVPFAIQWVAISVDEFIFHYRRPMPQWERIGHPLDTLTVLACYVWIFYVPPGVSTLSAFGALVIGSSLFVTKDEFHHKIHCHSWEHWLHALLFVTHPLALTGLGLAWPAFHSPHHPFLFFNQEELNLLKKIILIQAVGTALFFVYQVLYWNWWQPRRMRIQIWKK